MLRARLFKKHPHGGWSYHSTQSYPPSTQMKDLHVVLENVEAGDIVYASDFYMELQEDGTWQTQHPDNPAIRVLYGLATRAEEKAAEATSHSR